MKKITLLLTLLTVSFGFSQQALIEDFEGTAPSITLTNGLGSATVVTDPAMGTNGNVLEIVSAAAGDPWQQADLIVQTNAMDLTVDPTVTVDVYSTTAINILAKVDSGGTPSATDSNHGGSGWETLIFDFSDPKDGTSAADAEYSLISFFPSWAGDNSGNSTDNSDWFIAVDGTTFYIDNISAVAGEAVIPPDPAPNAAPSPTTPAANVFNIYSDTGGYTGGFDYGGGCFGALGGESDLDTGAGVNLAWEFDFGAQGFGCTNSATVDVSSIGGSPISFISFQYYTDNTNDFYIDMISGPGGATVESFYYIGTNIAGGAPTGDEAIVTGSWQHVVIDISEFTSQTFDPTELFQFKFDVFSVQGPATVYIDNVLLTSVAPDLSTDDFELTEFKVFPNPTNSDWNVSSNSIINTVTVFDILGKQVMTSSPNANETVIDASSLKTGMYFAKIESANGSKTVKLIRE